MIVSSVSFPAVSCGPVTPLAALKKAASGEVAPKDSTPKDSAPQDTAKKADPTDPHGVVERLQTFVKGQKKSQRQTKLQKEARKVDEVKSRMQAVQAQVRGAVASRDPKKAAQLARRIKTMASDLKQGAASLNRLGVTVERPAAAAVSTVPTVPGAPVDTAQAQTQGAQAQTQAGDGVPALLNPRRIEQAKIDGLKAQINLLLTKLNQFLWDLDAVPQKDDPPPAGPVAPRKLRGVLTQTAETRSLVRSVNVIA